jgi:hypothetical protein
MLELTSSTSGSRSVGIVRSWTHATEFESQKTLHVAALGNIAYLLWESYGINMCTVWLELTIILYWSKWLWQLKWVRNYAMWTCVEWRYRSMHMCECRGHIRLYSSSLGMLRIHIAANSYKNNTSGAPWQPQQVTVCFAVVITNAP